MKVNKIVSKATWDDVRDGFIQYKLGEWSLQVTVTLMYTGLACVLFFGVACVLDAVLDIFKYRVTLYILVATLCVLVTTILMCGTLPAWIRYKRCKRELDDDATHLLSTPYLCLSKYADKGAIYDFSKGASFLYVVNCLKLRKVEVYPIKDEEDYLRAVVVVQDNDCDYTYYFDFDFNGEEFESAEACDIVIGSDLGIHLRLYYPEDISMQTTNNRDGSIKEIVMDNSEGS